MAAITFNSGRALRLTSALRPRRRLVRTLETAMTKPTTQFQPLDPDVVSASIPAFFIGRNSAGLWVAREARGRVGGIFLLRSSAVHFANARSLPSRCALVFPSETFELDIDNRGNPLIAQLARWIDHARRHLARLEAKQQRSRPP